MRQLAILLACALPTLCLIGCGGGGDLAAPTEGGPDLGAATIEGMVLDVDGESALVAGVPLMCDETGEIVTSGPDGSFHFDALPEGDVTLSLATGGPVAGSRYVSRSDDGESDEGDEEEEADDDDSDVDRDEAGDDTERSDRRVKIRRVRRGDRLFIQIRIRGGVIIEIRLTRGGDADGSGGSGERELEIQMVKTEANDDPDMEGELELSVEANGDHEFEVEVEDATPGDLLEAVVIDPDGEEDSLGFRAVELDGDAEWKLDTGDGDELPFGVEGLGQLEGHRVVVRNVDEVDLLRARIPILPRRDDERDFCFRIRARARLVPQVDDVHGHVAMAARGCVDGDERRLLRQIFKIEAEGLTHGQEVEFFLEDPDEPGTLVSLGTIIANRMGEAGITFDTDDGDELPFGVATIRGLTGLRVQVRDDVTGDVLLEGRVPGTLED
jgi:hypothetical protein